jgi:hypothetical protein
MPIWHDLPARVKAEIEQFFLSATLIYGQAREGNGLARAESGTQIGQREPYGRNT